MFEIFITTSISALLVWEVLLLAPMVPGKLIDTRDFSTLPRWQFNGFNFFLTSLSLISLVVAGFAITGSTWVFWPSLVLSLLFVIRTFVVHPSFLKMGMGRALMDYSFELARQTGMKSIRLDVYEKNLPAISLYEKCGFEYIDTVDLG